MPEGASWPENVTITGGGSISPKLTATITISANLDKTHDGSAVSLDSSGYTYTGDTTTPTITITWHEDNSGTIGNQLTDNAAPSAPGTYWVKVSAAETNRYAAAEATKQFTISQPLDAPTNLKWDSDTPGQATWGTVTNASGYSVQLYKGGSTQGSPVTTSGTSYDFQITEAGSYTFTVTATGSGVYSDSSPSSQSTALHTVAFDTNGGTGTISMQLVPNGGTVTEPTAPTRTGHRFDGWYSDSNFAEGSKWTFSTSTVTAATALYAKWTAIDYDITITVQGGTGNTASASVNSTTATSANMGDTVTLTATPAEGYHFVEWQVTSGGVTISEQNTFTMPAGAVAITAVFEEHTFTGWTAGGNDTHTGTCSCGATTTRACTYENGVCTVCGYVDVTTTDPANSTVKEGETATFTVTATGDNVSCQWQSSINGGEWANISGATGSSYTTPAATMDMSGYQYRCVVSNTTGDSATSSAATLTVNKASSEIGDQKFVRYIVEHYKQNADGSYTLADTERPIGEVGETVTAVPKNYDGYTYNPNAAGTVTRGKLTEIKSDADIVTLKLYYDITLYTVTVNGSYAQTTGAGSYAEGATVAIDAGTRSGYTFDGWTSSDGVIFANAGSAQTTFTMPDQAVTITANWVKNSTEIGDQKFVRYIVEHYKQNADGSYTLADTERPIGEVGETVTAVPKTYDGYTYNPNAAGTVTSGKLTEIKSDADIVTLKLYYDITLYTVTVNNSYAQTTGAGSYAEGATVAIDAGTRDGYTFDGWTSSDGVTFANAGSAQTTFTMPDQAVTITANWVKNSTEIGDQKFVRYIVEHYKQNADGSYTLADTERPIGEVGETVTAAPKTYAGYTYNPNAVGTVSSGKLTEIKSNADIVTLKLYYDITLYTVTVNGSYAQTTGAGSYAEGATVAIDAGTRDGYTFDGWTGSDGVTFANAGSAQTTFTMPDQAVTVTANWVKKSTGGGGGGGSSYDYYTISATAGEGGSISPSGNISVREGRDKTFTITPHSGYVISDVRVDGVSVGAVASYTFDNVRRSHTIEATFAKGNPATGNPFTDVHPDDWFYDHVMFVYGNGLMNGTSATTFSPNEAATRAQVAVIFYRMAGSPAVTGDSPFTDVENGPGTAWYYNAVLWAHQNGIVAGYGDGTYHPGDPVTREQLAVMFYNYANYKGYDLSATSDLSGFTDAGKISDWALPAMRWAVGSGLMNGYGDGTLNPQGTATRAQLAAMLHNFIEHNKLVPSAVAPGGDSGTGGTSGTGSGGGGWTQQKPVPQTGDNSNIGLWISLCVLSFAGLVGTTIAYVHTKRRREEEAPDPLVI